MPDLNETSITADENEDIVNEETLSVRRAIANGKQAYSVAKSLEDSNKERNKVNATIWKKYNGGQPYEASALASAGETWRNNFPTGFMSGIVDRVVPVAPQIIDTARYLTSVNLKGDDPEASRKSEKFREIVTRYWRQWDGNKDLVYATSQENVLIGGTAWGWLDEDDPYPVGFRQDQFFLPDGTGQHAKDVPAVRFDKDYLIHEALEFIKDGKEIASAAGHDVDAWVETINEARPHGDDITSNDREYEDLVREGNMGMSYESGAKVIKTIHLLVTEPETSKVTHYIMDGRGDHKVLYQKDDRYNSITDCLCLFTLQPGNGKFYGSKGLGKLLINLHLAIERLRNLTADAVGFACRKILKVDPTKKLDMQLRVDGPFMVVGTEGDFEQKQLVAGVQDFLLLDQKFTNLAENAAGAYIPDPMSPDEGGETATAKRIDYAREQQTKIAFLSRFSNQIGTGLSTFQKRLCNRDSSHEKCKLALKEMEEAGLKPEDIKELSESPASEVAQDLTQVQNGQIEAVAQAVGPNPMIDQAKMLKRRVTALSNPQIADDLILPDSVDPSMVAEQSRAQAIENIAIMGGAKHQDIPVSPRDSHPIHLQTTEKDMVESWPEVVQKAQAGDPDTPQLLDCLSEGLLHAEEHIAVWEAGGAEPDVIKPFKDKIEEADKALMDLAKGFAEMQQQPEMPQGGEMMPPEGQQMPPQEQAPQEAPEAPQMPPPLDINQLFKVYKDLPEHAKRKAEEMWGLSPSIEEQVMMQPPLPDEQQLIEQQGIAPEEPAYA